MRIPSPPLATLALATLACSTDPPVSPAFEPAEPEPTWTTVVAGRLEIAVRDRLASHGAETGVVVRLTNHGEQPLLLDLRDVDRVPHLDVEPATRVPLGEARTAELAEVSGLTSIAGSASVTYAVPTMPPDCEGTRTAAFGGVLYALDGDRTIEIVADGASAPLSCAAPLDAPEGTSWVSGHAPFTAAAASDDFGAGLPELIRAASVTGAADVALLPFSFDARPVERWRYDACVAAGVCPARAVVQPPGSIRAPAVGMTQAGVEAFCAHRGLRALTSDEVQAVADPGRPLVAGGPPDVVVTGLRCARTEDAAPSP